MNESDQFNKHFFKHYQFWLLCISVLSIFAVAYLSWQSYKVQLVLKKIEETRQKEKFSNDLDIIFFSNAFSEYEPEKATYNLKFVNNSSNNFKDFETMISICYEDRETKDIKKFQIFTFPPKDLFPSDIPVSFMESSELTKTFRFNISEAKKILSVPYKPKSFEFFFKWYVEIGNDDYLLIKKRKDFPLNR